ncbi:transglutaminase-like domain-containing protein [Methanogenium organophilum]|uniref:Transglutaminase domain-containing protein n=1 Tax=Methanogenium organophilum TaxID=2199 RepID=A0A9X9S2I9_METOG|nr:transglutaminase domain-containing protein [Methanogenium organophilum]WAI00343.1 transglutaminase domain-containing protein [Methanogenium organophilum]
MSPVIPGRFAGFVLLVILFVAAAGCLSTSDDEMTESSIPATNTADDIALQADAAMANTEYQTAAALYEEAYELFTVSGDTANALLARNGMFRAKRAVIEYPYNRTAAEAAMQERIPMLTEADMNAWLDERAQTIESDGEVFYFENVAADFLYAHFDYIRPMTGKMMNFGYVSRYAVPGESSSAAADGALPYVNPVRYGGTEELVLPADTLPETGTLSIWYPLPLETESQQDVVVTNLSYAEYIVKGPVTDGQIAYVYYEIPADAIEGDLVITADIAFTSYEQLFAVDPALVEPYDPTDPEYLLYTSSSRNIDISDDVRALAKEIVGGETNPYLQAQAIYRYIIDTYPYSTVPHVSIDTVEPKVAESDYMLSTGHGDCGTQSMLFTALCRSLGIPARATGGYQMLLTGNAGSHFWAEYYIEGYGWIPCDKTVAEIADWVEIGEDEREAFKTYYANNLDPARFVIQKDVDVIMDPAFPKDAVVFRLVRQAPAVVCDSADVDFGTYIGTNFSIHIEAEE